MARNRKKGVDYFPHDASHKKTLFILEQQWGNDGYAVWFKLLEALSVEEKHYLDLSDEATELHLAAKCRVTVQTLRDILDVLSKLGAISSELWAISSVVWSQNFVNRIADAYRLRKDSLPTFPSDFLVSSEKISVCSVETAIPSEEMQQRERERESKEDNPPVTPPRKNQDIVDIHQKHFTSMHGGLMMVSSHLQAFDSWKKNGKTAEEIEQAYVDTASARSPAKRFQWICEILSGRARKGPGGKDDLQGEDRFDWAARQPTFEEKMRGGG